MVPPFSLCVCRFFLSGPPLASGGLSFLPRTFISGRQTQAYCFVCYYCNRIGTKFTKEKTILPNSFLPYTCRILSLICSLAGSFPSYAALPNSFPHMRPCRILSFIITLPNALRPNNLVKCIASICRPVYFMLDLFILHRTIPVTS